MSVAAGTRLGPYEIQSAIGAGGMGEVYKAKDTRLDRSVAIKILPPEVSADPERRARFEREAKTIAGLNHPHICTLHDVGEHEGSTFLVMEHLTGETLARRLEKGPLPLEQALSLATEIADALSAAHRQGVIHRDLKPGNVMLTKSGAKLLDFGLAKLKAHGERPAAESLASAPTRTAPLTSEGQIVGTLQYMAPEQVEGKPADARTDLWALGTILYEMLTGKRAFEGRSAASLITAIMGAEPPALATLQPLTPPSVDRLVRKCLAKDPDARWQAASDVADELKWVTTGSGTGSGVSAAAGVRPRRRRGLAEVLVVAGVLAAGASGAGLMSLLRPIVPPARPVHLHLDIRPAGGVGAQTPSLTNYNRPSRTAVALTPDGRRLVFEGTQGNRHVLYVQNLEKGEATWLPNTDRAIGPFLSPDGQWVGFWVEAGYPATGWVLKKTLLDGSGTPSEIARIPGLMPFGASWADDDTIVFPAGESGGLLRVSSNGGMPEEITRPQPGEYSHRLPHVLPGAKAVLFTVVESIWNWKAARVVVHRFGTQKWDTLVTDAADARFVPTGHLIYFRRGQLFAAPFDPARPQRIGSERALLSNVMQATNGVNSYFNSGAAQLALSSSSGTLAYLSGGEFPDVNRLIVWVDRQGKVEQFHVPAKPYYLPRLSPDDQQVAVQTLQSERRVWVHDLRRPDSLTPVTALELEAYHHIWSRDGTRLAFCASPNGRYGLFWARGDGTQPAGERLNASDSWLATASWADDDKLLYVRYDAKTRFDVWMLSRDDDNWSSHVLLNAEGDEQDARVSPNGRWLAYSRSETGMGREISYVYVRRFPEPTGQRQVGEGSEPVWARDGKELFYIRRSAATFELVAHNVAPDGTVAPAGRALFDLTSRRLTRYYPVPGYDVTRDGRRFVFAQNPDTPVPSPTDRIDVILNWFEELKAKALVK